ncbi:glycosyltransferase [Amedibacillus dolichus]|uniref:glycosyltransferase n=1 Tax=Amedibacillus dolichus TaxID=31971 RepID=UPI002942AEB9|nr:glycosyltransferase [Amedibacillus dolichus]
MVIMYIGNIGYPNTAPSVHVRNRGIFMNSCGHEVYILCETAPNGNKMENLNKVKYEYMDSYPGKGKIRGIYWNLDQVCGRFYYKQSQNYISKIKPDVVILYEPNSLFYILSMLKLSHRKGFKLIIETTEWRNPKDYKGIITRIINTEKDLQKKHIDKKVGNVIAISRYLYQHYSKQNCNCILLPPIFSEVGNGRIIKSNTSNNGNVLRLVYAGSMSSKDYIDTLLKAIMRINKDEIRITFDIIGPEKAQVKKLIGIENLEKVGIYSHGKLPHDETVSIVEKADLSVLLRMDKRYAKAGVSTKFCEAMMLGVPSICTSVGGTDLFVNDGVNGFLVENNEIQTLEKTLLDILKLSREQITEIKNNAILTANELFTAEKYREQFNDFLSKCI